MLWSLENRGLQENKHTRVQLCGQRMLENWQTDLAYDAILQSKK